MRYGVPWSCREIADKARAAKHHYTKKVNTSDILRRAIFNILTPGRKATRQKHRATLDDWK